ncbi:MAG: hypothetical protein B6241_09290 [Spirochaetaceae bacterium 4572_59]|nr:MAG: hypothetical protein B6241_09290 [Spirochaetaceae bacterium 4572_59]
MKGRVLTGPRRAESRARFHLEKAVAMCDGLSPSPYLSFALGIPVMQQNYDEFEGLLNRALAIDPADDPDNELLIVLYQDKARWYLEHREDYFLLDF